MDTNPTTEKNKENYRKKIAKTFLWTVDFLWRTVIITIRAAIWGTLALLGLFIITLCFDPPRAIQGFDYIKTWFV